MVAEDGDEVFEEEAFAGEDAEGDKGGDDPIVDGEVGGVAEGLGDEEEAEETDDAHGDEDGDDDDEFGGFGRGRVGWHWDPGAT